MNETQYMVYYTDPADKMNYGWHTTILKDALSVAEQFRQRGMIFVTMVGENVNHVGKSGVDTVTDGKLPDGFSYDWNKNSRIGATKKR